MYYPLLLYHPRSLLFPVSSFYRWGLCLFPTSSTPRVHLIFSSGPFHGREHTQRMEASLVRPWMFQHTVCVCAQSCPTFCDPMGCSPPSFSVHGIFQARILEWVAISFSRGSSQPKDQTHVFCIGRQFLYHWATWEAQIPNPQQHQRLQVSFIQDSGF